MNRAALAGVIATAVSDALGKYGDQTELRAELRHLAEKGDRLQVAGLIDLGRLGEYVATQVIAVVQREHPEIGQESWDDI